PEFGGHDIFPLIMTALFETAETAFKLVLGLVSIMTLWMGLLKVGEDGGVIRSIARFTGPFLRRLFPEIPPDHPAMGQIVMNFSANVLGMDNAATPLGLKAMTSLQEINPEKDRASNAQIMFLVLNSSSLTLFPMTIIALRGTEKAANPTDVFIPIIIATFFSTLTGLLLCTFRQRIRWDFVLLSGIFLLSGLVAFMIWHFASLAQDQLNWQSKLITAILILGLIAWFIARGFLARINVFDSFLAGAKDGFGFTLKLLPYILGILVAVAVFRASGCMDAVLWAIEKSYVAIAGIFVEHPRTDFIPGLPTGLLKPLSGGGARGLMVETMIHYGADSIPGRLSCIIQGSTETTFYVLAVYFGSVGITKTRYTLGYGLLADLAGLIAAIFVTYVFFG
ncbi:MAG TPA: nucleoside recognition domain-containing protein, partial [Bacteroidia bacterium]|nr:nucleoside recognition domain-containing protein [Bacteroidia bacterium]